MAFNEPVKRSEFVRRFAAERTRTADSRGSYDKRSMRIASDYPAFHSTESFTERVCFVLFPFWQTVSSQKREYNQGKFVLASEKVRAVGFTTGRPPAQETARRYLCFFRGFESSQFRVPFLSSRCLRAFCCHVTAYIPESISRVSGWRKARDSLPGCSEYIFRNGCSVYCV